MKNVLEQWGPEFASAEAQPLKEGVWQLELGAQTYILKRRSNRTRVWEEYNLLQWLHKHGQPISQLVCTTVFLGRIPWFLLCAVPYLAGTPAMTLICLNKPWPVRRLCLGPVASGSGCL